ncbi:hypothetical protein N7451_006591 [Penicillium sp. IBT 35674x]|nr:hypothetical protein N7451_006591 [Penicillium sp. IBT 35674x]
MTLKPGKLYALGILSSRRTLYISFYLRYISLTLATKTQLVKTRAEPGYRKPAYISPKTSSLLYNIVIKVIATKAGILRPKKLAPIDPGFTPILYKEAVSYLEYKRWRATIYKELSHHNHNST